MTHGFAVSAAAGSLRGTVDADVEMPHPWTDAGVAVNSPFTGAHLLHLAAAGCVLNDLYREADRLGLVLDGVRVDASGGFDTDTWQSTGISYRVELDSAEAPERLAELLRAVDEVAEIPRSLRAGTTVTRDPEP
jgi:uncharacterized OsmC-like protein